MLEVYQLPVKSMVSPEPKIMKKNNTNETNNAFIDIMLAVQSNEGQPFNFDVLLNQTLKNEIMEHPKFQRLIENIPDNVLTEFKSLIGQPIKRILSESNTSPESKTLALIASSFQLKEKGFQPKGIINIPITKPIMSQNTDGETTKIQGLQEFQLKDGLKAHQHDVIKTNESLKSNETLRPQVGETIKPNETLKPQATETNKTTEINKPQITETFKGQTKDAITTKTTLQAVTVEKSAAITKIPTTAEVILPSLRQNFRTISNEVQTYGEFRLERASIPIIQVNTADSPEQTQQNFMKQLETLLKSSRSSQIAKNHSQMTIQLRPDTLGYMTIKIEQVNQEIVARIITSSNATKELIESNLHQLRHMNIQVDKFDVQLQQSNNQQLLRDQEQQQQQRQSQKEDTNKENNEQPTQTFKEQLEKILP